VDFEYSVALPVACSLTADELRARGVENADLFTRAQSVIELADGYRFTFPAGDDDARDLLTFVRAEAACCPFFTFELAFPSPHETILLSVRGNEDAKEMVRESVVSKLTAPAYEVAGATPAA
jgi:hypothetical protein